MRHRPRGHRPVGAAALLIALGGCHQLLGYSSGDAGRGDSAPVIDEDATADGADASFDTAPPLPPPSLTCNDPVELVGRLMPEAFFEPAVFPDGLKVAARSLDTADGVYNWSISVIKRPSLDAAFGDWEEVSGQQTVADLSFFPDGVRFLGAETGGETRRLLSCSWAGPCGPDQALSFDAPPGTDLDGADLFFDAKRFLFNAGPDSLSGQIFLAEKAPAADAWSARALPELELSDRREDDPAISRDGLLVVFAVGAVGRDDEDDIWYATRRDESLPFGQPRPIESAAINQLGADEGSPDLSFALSEAAATDRRELFFSSDRDRVDLPRIYHTSCTISF